MSRRVRARASLTVERIAAAAIRIADRDGLDALSMRRLGAELDADPMAVYHHVGDKSALLSLMTDRVIAQIVPVTTGAWQEALRETIMAARATALDHPWMARVLAEIDHPGPATLQFLDTVFGILRGGGLSVAMTHHAIHLLGSRVLGFSQDLFDDGAAPRPSEEDRRAQAAAWRDDLPHLAELAAAADHDGGLGGCDDDQEFAFALNLLIEGLARRA